MTARVPPGWSTITPRIVTPDVAGLVGFLRAVFDVEGEAHADRPAELRIGGSMLMISDGGGVRASQAAFLHVYVDHVDARYDRALAGGASPIEPPADMPYGDRRATVRDPWGNLWQLAAYRGAAPG